MKNYWLDKRKEKYITSDQMQAATVAFQKNRTADNAKELADMLRILCTNIIDYARFKFLCDNKTEATAECMKMCFQKVDRFNGEKGKAFNFFTTIMLSHMRQMYRKQRSYKELKEKHKKHMENK